MRPNKTYIILFSVLITGLFGNKIQACSMYKITVDGKTMVGCNELAKGDHTLGIPDLFPQNSEFERLAAYKTPFNTPVF